MKRGRRRHSLSQGASENISDTRQDLRELNLWVAKPKTVAIPWLEFTKDEIMALLSFHFNRLGYVVKNASMEEAVVECTKGDGYKVIVAVASHEDDAEPPSRQMNILKVRLASVSANRRVFVFLTDPPPQVAETARDLQVEIWNLTHLESELSSSWLTQELLIDNCPLVSELMTLSWLLIDTGEKARNSRNLRKVRLQNAPELMEIFWSLKDRAVTLQKNCMLLQYLSERTDFKVQDREIFEANLTFISTYGSRPILDLFRSNGKLLMLTKEVYKLTYGRSNWLELAGFGPGLRPGRLRRAMTRKDFPFDSFNSPIDAQEIGQEVWRRFSVVTGGLEATIDDMYITWFGRPGSFRTVRWSDRHTTGKSYRPKISNSRAQRSQPRMETSLSKRGRTIAPPSEIFIIHGQDETSNSQLKAIIQEFGLHPIVLEEEPARGLTIIERLEKEGQEAGYAFVLLTPDDDGRPRQNVVLEYGMFATKLGRDRTCLLRKDKTELPSDMQGITYIQFERNLSEIKHRIGRELIAAGFNIRNLD